METRQDKPRARSDGKASWERPAVTLAGTISLLVRGGSAGGKGTGEHDGDNQAFECRPDKCPQN
jgi:hypothetical protein